MTRRPAFRTITGGHLDVAPTLLSLLGIVDDETPMLGHDLTRGRDAFVVSGMADSSKARRSACRAGGLAAAQCHNVATGEAIDAARLRTGSTWSARASISPT